MGREIRRVPLDWEHPKDVNGNYIPHYDQDLDSAKSSYNPDDGESFYEESYRLRKWDEQEAVGYQLYESTSEGTPLSPVFETTDDLIEYITNDGDFWGNVWSKSSCDSLLKYGSAPTLLVANGILLSPHEQREISRKLS